MLVRDRSSDEEIRTMAYDIALTQQHQGGQMFAWLREWGLSQTSSIEPMAWMHPAANSTSHGAHGSPTAVSQESKGWLMPGMASPADVDRLRDATGKEADTLYLTLMISHHQGGVAMAEAAVKGADTESVRALAEQMVVAQASEIAAMQQMLTA